MYKQKDEKNIIKVTTIGLTRFHLDLLNLIVKTGYYSNRSELIRNALNFFFMSHVDMFHEIAKDEIFTKIESLKNYGKQVEQDDEQVFDINEIDMRKGRAMDQVISKIDKKIQRFIEQEEQRKSRAI
ncbi:MAG: hypothetical protein ACTSYS_14075 [Promethearchaeota archaeon]